MVGGWVRRLLQNVSRLSEYDTTGVVLSVVKNEILCRIGTNCEQIVFLLSPEFSRTDGRTEFYCLVRPIIANRQWIMAG